MFDKIFKQRTIVKVEKSSVRESLITNGFDKPLLAFTAGSAAAIIKAMITLLGQWLGLSPINLTQVSGIILTRNMVHGIGQSVLGWLMLVIIGGLIGMGLYYSLYFLGRDYIYLKAIGAGILFWLINTSIAAIPLGVPAKNYSSLSGHLVFFTSGIVYGIALGFLFKKLVFIKKNLINQ